MTIHIAKNFMDLPKIKIPLILGIWGGKGQGKTFQVRAYHSATCSSSTIALALILRPTSSQKLISQYTIAGKQA
jgi:hypothetical protein